MSLRKPILKVTRECSKCYGDAKIEDIYHGSHQSCKKCKGTSRIDVKQSNRDFKKYYKIALEERIEDLTVSYRNTREVAHRIGEELSKYCKELDKVVNK